MISVEDLKERLEKNYNGEEFYIRLSEEIEKAGLKKGYFLKKIGKPSNWLIRRKDNPPSPGSLLLIEQEFGIDVLRLITNPSKKMIISYDKNKEIIINGEKINLSAIHAKVMVILFHEGPEKKYLLDTIDTCYDNIQKKLRELKIKNKL